MIRVIIVEDEHLSANRLIRILNENENDIRVVKRFDTILKTVTYLNSNSLEIDLIFLDIHLADGNAFEIFNQTDISIPIIFTTAYDQYAIKAFKHASVDYLLKPIQEKELEQSIDKFKQLYFSSKEDLARNYTKLIETFAGRNITFKDRFLVHVGSKIRSVESKEIDVFYAENKACFLITRERKTYDIDYTLKSLENELDPNLFYRVNRKVIVNIHAIKEIEFFSIRRYRLQLISPLDFEIIISKERITEFKQWMGR